MVDQHLTAAIDWVDGTITEYEGPNSFGFLDMMSLATDTCAIDNLRDLLDEVDAKQEVAKPITPKPRPPSYAPPAKGSVGRSTSSASAAAVVPPPPAPPSKRPRQQSPGHVKHEADHDEEKLNMDALEMADAMAVGRAGVEVPPHLESVAAR